MNKIVVTKVYLFKITFAVEKIFARVVKYTEYERRVTLAKGTASACAEGLTLDRMGLGNDRIPYSRSNISAPVIFQGSQVQDMWAIYMPPHVMKGGGRKSVNNPAVSQRDATAG